MTRNATSTNAVLIFVSFLWGLGFVPQRLGLDTFEPMAFNAWRFLFGAITLIPILFLVARTHADLKQADAVGKGAFLGALLTFGAGLQQISIGMTTIANVAFITGFYVIFVPIIGFVMGYRYQFITWLGAAFAIAGLAMLSGFAGEFRLDGDTIALVGAVFWAFHLLAITKFVQGRNEYVLAFYQFLFCALFSASLSFAFEDAILPARADGFIWSSLNGIFVVGIAYTLQVAVLKHADPFVASIIFSLETVFGALAGYLFFQEVLGLSGIVGASLMLVGCILAQLPKRQ